MSVTYDLVQNWRATIDQSGDWRVVRLHQPQDGATVVYDLADALWSKLGSPPPTRVLLEMVDVHFLASSVMGELVRLHKRLAVQGDLLHLCGLHPECREALHITRLDRVLPTFDSREEALRSTAV
jgi:anti-anti-sigma factor